MHFFWFCDIKKSGCAHENELAYASYDSYPVSKHHCLVIPKRHIKDYFDLTNEELLACNNLIKIVKNEIINKDQSVKGFNVGTNIGKVSGQSIFHCHIHLIPRREGGCHSSSAKLTRIAKSLSLTYRM